MLTISDVARAAGVSTATVSRTLSQPDMVSEATRLRVMRFVEELGYEPNSAARSLRTRRAYKLLLTVADISHSFIGGIVRGAERAAREAGFALIVADTLPAPEHRTAHAAMLRSHEVDGIIVTEPALSAPLGAIVGDEGRDAPIVCACEFTPSMGVSGVRIDDFAAASEVIDHLAGLGHRRIGIVSGPLMTNTATNRLAGARSAAARLGIADRLEIRVAAGFSIEDGSEHARSLIAEGVTAIFCFSDDMAIGALSSIRQAGLSCPADISVVGFDDVRVSRYLQPALTTVAQPVEEMGAAAVQLLLRIVLNEADRDLADVVLGHRLMLRESCAAPAGERRS